MSYGTLKYPSAWVPLAMSLAALCIVVGHLILVGPVSEVDEGAAAHLFQLLMAGQVPIVAFFAIKWLRQAPGRALPVMGLQALACVLACAPVWYFQL